MDKIKKFIKICHRLNIDNNIIAKTIIKHALYKVKQASHTKKANPLLLTLLASIAAGTAMELANKKSSNLEILKNIHDIAKLKSLNTYVPIMALGGGIYGYNKGSEMFPDINPTTAKIVGGTLGASAGALGGSLASSIGENIIGV